MAFVQVVTVRDVRSGKRRPYAYLVTNQWNPERKMPVPLRKHLGAYDPEAGTVSVSVALAGHPGLTVPLSEVKERAAKGGDVAKWLAAEGEKSWPGTARAKVELERIEVWGVTAAFMALAAKTGLDTALAEGFGKDDAEALLALAIHRAATGHAAFRAAAWLEGTPLAKVKRDLSSAGISRLHRRIGENVDGQARFRRAWLERCGHPRSLVCDTTSISTRSVRLRDAEYGYNRDHESLPQVNLILVHAREKGLPLAWRLVPGSVPDVATLTNTARFLREDGLAEFGFALDKGFYSRANLRDLAAAGLDFVVGVPLHVKWAQAMLRRKRTALESLKRMFSFGNRELHHVSEPVELACGEETVRAVAHLYLDPLRRQDMLAGLKRRVMALVEKAGGERFRNRREAVEWLAENAGGLERCFAIRNQAGTAGIVHRPGAMARAGAAMGYSLLLASDRGRDREGVLGDYRSRDAVEKLFDMLKNHLDGNRLRTGEEEAVQGRLAIGFTGLVLRQSLENALKDHGLHRRLGVPEALDELAKARAAVLRGGRRLVLETPKQVRQILAAAGTES